ncbi:MAG: hypothetical protein J6N52_04395 [Clostridia bacterium]|nr:hypothetical protein [Clostridia bacterium]
MKIEDLFKDKEDLTVAFLGGSITEGTNKATPGKFYVDIVGNEFKKHFKNTKIVNAGWGGTGTDFGLYRVQKDICAFNPDIVFIEFACNDVVLNNHSSMKYLDSIIGILQSLPKLPYICLIYTTDNVYHTRINEHNVVAKHYGIPAINICEHIRELVDAKKISFEEIFGDAIHPNNYGYEIYSRFIIEKIFDETESCLKYASTKKPLFTPQIKNPGFVSVDEATINGESKKCKLVNKHLPAATELKKGETLTFTFEGSGIGVVCEDMYLFGTAKYSVDDKIEGVFSAEPYVIDLLIHGLTNGKHEIKLEVISDEPMRIGAFAVNG